MSKRSNANLADLSSFRNQGYTAEEILAFILRLGWSPSDPNYDRDNPPIDKTTAIQMFLTNGKMKTSSPLLDINILHNIRKK